MIEKRKRALSLSYLIFDFMNASHSLYLTIKRHSETGRFLQTGPSSVMLIRRRVKPTIEFDPA